MLIHMSLCLQAKMTTLMQQYSINGELVEEIHRQREEIQRLKQENWRLKTKF